MFALRRRAGVLLAGLLAAGALAGQADAATTKVRLHTKADTTRYLTEDANGLASMRPSNASDPAQKWLKTTTDSGFAVYTNVKTGHCLTGRGLQGAPIVTAEKCFPGATKQQWNLGVSGDFKLRLNGFVAQVNPSTLTGVLMAFFTVKPNQQWHTHPAS